MLDSIVTKELEAFFRRNGGVSDKADFKMNCSLGQCPNGCIYCNPNATRKRMGKDKRPSCQFKLRCGPTNGESRNSLNWIIKRAKKYDVIQVPTVHDITDVRMVSIFSDAIIKILLETEAIVVVHSKMSLEVACLFVQYLSKFSGSKRLVFQITINTVNPDLMKALEPRAPSYYERMKSLRLLHKFGFNTSVSCTPALDTNVEGVYRAVRPYVSCLFHIGALLSTGKSNVNGMAKSLFKNIYRGRSFPSRIHPKDASLRPLLKDWVENYDNLFGTSWAKKMLWFESMHVNVICERDVYELAKSKTKFNGTVLTLLRTLL